LAGDLHLLTRQQPLAPLEHSNPGAESLEDLAKHQALRATTENDQRCRQRRQIHDILVG
jgi:hypothetical protein